MLFISHILFIFFLSIIRFLEPNGRKRRLLYTFALELLRNNHMHKFPEKGIYNSESNYKRGKHPLDVKILGQKLPYNLPLVKRVSCAKFHCICSYRVQMHKEQTNRQTNRQTNILLYIYRCFISY